MCTTPRQVLPSVFGGNAYPRGLRRYLGSPDFPDANDNDAQTEMDITLGIGLGGTPNGFHRRCCRMSARMCAQV